MGDELRVLSPDDLFVSGSLSQNLVQKSVRGGVTTLTSQILQFTLTIIGTVILARLLTPQDYGLVAMVTVVVNFLAMFKDAGLSMATVQKQEITHEQISTLFWLNILISVGLGLSVLAISPLVAWFYGKPELAAITATLSLSFILSGMTIQHLALLRRHMHFGTLAVIQIASQIINLIVTITLATHGWRYWALIGGTLTHSLVGSLLTFIYCPWIPGWMRRGTGVVEMLKFGGHLTGFNIVNYFARNFDNFIIGKFLGADALGIYSRAYHLLLLPITLISGPLSSVAVPSLSRLAGNKVQLHKYYLHILYILSLVAGLIAGISFVASGDIVIVFLGTTWSDVGDVFRLLAIGALLQPIYNTQAWLHLAVGRADRVFTWGLIGTPIIVASFFIGLPWGINGVAFCYSISIIITTILSLTYAGKSADLSISKIFAIVIKPILSCIAAVIAVSALNHFVVLNSHVFSIITKCASFMGFYLLSLFFMYKGFKPIRDLIEIRRIYAKADSR